MIIRPIVEGQGDEAAVPVLLRRLLSEAGAWQVQIARPHRRRRSQLVKKDTLQAALRVALLDPCDAVLVLFDADDDCPKELAPQLSSWTQQVSGGTPCAVVMANREYEAWLLGGLEGFARHDQSESEARDPEAVRDAKTELRNRLPGPSYLATADQARLTALIDLEGAYRSCRSFRKLVGAFGQLLATNGLELPAWPPGAWRA